jgi:hypothetical protein
LVANLLMRPQLCPHPETAKVVPTCKTFQPPIDPHGVEVMGGRSFPNVRCFWVGLRSAKGWRED